MRVAIPGHYANVLGGIGTYARLLIEAVTANAPAGSAVISAEPGQPDAIGSIASTRGGLQRMAWEQLALPES